MPSSSEELLKSMHQSNQGAEEKCLQGETAVAPWPCMRACLPPPYMQEVWTYIIFLKGCARMFSDMRLACPTSLNHSLEGIATRVVTSRQKHTSIPDVLRSFLLHTSFRKKKGWKTNKLFSYSLSQELLSVSASRAATLPYPSLLQALLVPDTAKKHHKTAFKNSSTTCYKLIITVYESN